MPTRTRHDFHPRLGITASLSEDLEYGRKCFVHQKVHRVTVVRELLEVRQSNSNQDSLPQSGNVQWLLSACGLLGVTVVAVTVAVALVIVLAVM